jgi:hypothetical protein
MSDELPDVLEPVIAALALGLVSLRSTQER